MSAAEERIEAIAKSIASVIESFTFCSFDDIISASRAENIPVSRRILVNIMMTEFGSIGPSSISRCIRKDHSTIYHYIKTHNNLYDTDKSYKQLYFSIVNKVRVKLSIKDDKSITISKMVSDSSILDIVIACVDDADMYKRTSNSFLRKNPIIIFEGNRESLLSMNYESILDYNKERYLTNLSENNQGYKWYKNYSNNLYTIRNDKEASIKTVLDQLPTRKSIIIFAEEINDITIGV